MRFEQVPMPFEHRPTAKAIASQQKDGDRFPRPEGLDAEGKKAPVVREVRRTVERPQVVIRAEVLLNRLESMQRSLAMSDPEGAKEMLDEDIAALRAIIFPSSISKCNTDRAFGFCAILRSYAKETALCAFE